MVAWYAIVNVIIILIPVFILFDFIIAVQPSPEWRSAICAYGVVQSWGQSSTLIDLLTDKIVGDLVALIVEVLVAAVGTRGVESLLVYHTVFPQDFMGRAHIVDWLLVGSFCLVQRRGRPCVVFYPS